MTFDYEKVIPAPIPMKRAPDKKRSFEQMHPTYTTGLHLESKKTSQAFRAKVEADLKRLGIK